IWTRTGLGRLSGSVAGVGNLVFAGSETARLRGFAASTGIEAFPPVSTTAAIGSSLAISHGALFMSDSTDRLYSVGNLLDPPEHLTALVQGTNIKLNWDAVFIPPTPVPASGYRVYRSTQPEAGFSLLVYLNG